MKCRNMIRKFQFIGMSFILCATATVWAGSAAAQTNEPQAAATDKPKSATTDAAVPSAEAKPAPQPRPAAAVDYVALPEPMAFAKEKYATVLRLNGMAPSKDRDAKLRAFVDDLIDYDDYAIRSMGDRWPTLPADKQVAYQQKFRELLELTYLKRFSDKSFKDDYKIDWDRVVKKKDSAIVSCFTQQKDVETEFEIILHAVDNRWQIYDTLVDGASLAKTYQKKYAKKLDERGIDGLLIDMQTEIDKLKKM